MIRTFIAFELKNQDTIDKIKAFCTRLKQNQPNIKLVELENVHLTMKFLGNIEESTAPKIYKILKESINEKLIQGKTLEYKLKSVGQFKQFSVVWIRIDGDVSFFQTIKDTIEDLLKKQLKIERDNHPEFEPHLTIGRLKHEKINHRTFDSFKNLIRDANDIDFGNFSINQIKLKQSVLTPKGPIYSDLVY